jgi:hypothetical protein
MIAPDDLVTDPSNMKDETLRKVGVQFAQDETVDVQRHLETMRNVGIDVGPLQQEIEEPLRVAVRDHPGVIRTIAMGKDVAHASCLREHVITSFAAPPSLLEHAPCAFLEH